MEYFDDEDTDDTGDIGDSGDTGNPVDPDNPTDVIDNIDDALDNDDEVVVKEREYVDFRSVHSDDTIDIGIVNKEIEPEPEEPDAPYNPNPIVPEEPEKPEPKPDEPVKENTPSVSTSDEANVGTYMYSTAISGLAMVYLFILERKRRRG